MAILIEGAGLIHRNVLAGLFVVNDRARSHHQLGYVCAYPSPLGPIALGTYRNLAETIGAPLGLRFAADARMPFCIIIQWARSNTPWNRKRSKGGFAGLSPHSHTRLSWVDVFGSTPAPRTGSLLGRKTPWSQLPVSSWKWVGGSPTPA